MVSHPSASEGEIFLFYIVPNDLHKGPDSAYDELYGPPASKVLLLNREIKERSALYYLYRTIGGIIRAREADLHHRRVKFEALEWGRHPTGHRSRGLDANSFTEIPRPTSRAESESGSGWRYSNTCYPAD